MRDIGAIIIEHYSAKHHSLDYSAQEFVLAHYPAAYHRHSGHRSHIIVNAGKLIGRSTNVAMAWEDAAKRILGLVVCA